MKNDIIDFHSHILPGVDHGSRNVITSQKQIGILNNAGIDRVVATSHFYPQETSVSDFLSLRSSGAKKLIDSIKDNKTELPRIALGAELLVCEGLHRMERLSELTIKGTNCLLLELPFNNINDEILDTVEYISKSFTAVLAHIDRYPLSDILNLLECPNIFAQLNATALTGFIKNKDYMTLIDCDQVVAIGSDIHKDDEKAGKQFTKALEKIGKERTARIMEHTSDILSNAEYIN